MNENSSNNTETETAQERMVSRKTGVNDFSKLHRRLSTVAVMENQQQFNLRRALISFLLQFIAKALTFVISLITSTFALDQIFPQASDSQPRLRLTNSLKQRLRACKHPAHKNLEKTALIYQIPTAYFELMVQDSKTDKRLQRSDIASASNSLNSSIVDRLLEIDARAPNNVELKLLNYQEWVDMLLKINKVLLKNLCDLESEFVLNMKSCCMKNAERSRLLESYQADITRLIQFIMQAETNNYWNIRDYIFETFEASEVFKKHNNEERVHTRDL